MDARDLLLAQHASVHSAQVAGGQLADGILGGLSDDQMRVRPGKGLNSLAWLLWHMTRTEDVGVNVVVTDGRQVLDEGWTERLGIARRDIGTGMTGPRFRISWVRHSLRRMRATGRERRRRDMRREGGTGTQRG